jgi:hypothetical protein
MKRDFPAVLSRYCLSLFFALLALFGGGLYLYETLHIPRVETDLQQASISELKLALTIQEKQQIETEEANRLARHAVLENEVHRSMTFSLVGLLACLIGVVAALLALPGFLRLRGTANRSLSNSARTLFISYNHRNFDLAKHLQEELRASGVKAELIEAILDVQGGQELKAILQSRILNHPAVVVLLTPEALNSQWVAFERALADSSLSSVIYAFNRIGLFRAIWVTNFLPRSQSFRALRMLKAQRRYVAYPSENASKLIRGHVELAILHADGISPARQFLGSFTPADKALFTSLFNHVENRMILAPKSYFWRATQRLSMALQVYLALVPVVVAFYFLFWAIPFITEFLKSIMSG